jgi:hypothetical protein
MKRKYVDVTARSQSMPRNSALLYRNRTPRNADSPVYLGVLKLADGTTFWVGVWPRSVKGETVVEIQLCPKP